MTIELPCYDITLEVSEGSGVLHSGLPEYIDYEKDGPEDIKWKEDYNHMMDAITSMILAHACAGIDVAAPAYIEGIETAVEACAQYDCANAGDGS